MDIHSEAFPNLGMFGGVLVVLGTITIVYICSQNYATRRLISGKDSARRKLDANEQLLDLCSQEKDGVFNIGLIITLRSKKELAEQTVRTALVLLAKRQPMLRAVVKTTPSQSTRASDRYFEIIDGENIADWINFSISNVNARDWQRNMWYEVTAVQRENGLLWRAVLLQQEFLPGTEEFANTLIVGFCHCCVDGVSTMKFCEQFSRYLNEVASGIRCVDDSVSSLPLSPGLLDLLGRTPLLYLWRFFAKSLCIRPLLKLIFKGMSHREFKRKRCNPVFVQSPPESLVHSKPSQIIVKVFTTSETACIVEACRANDSTVTGALLAAVHLAFCKLVEKGLIDQEEMALEYLLAINGRRNCQPAPHNDYLGDFAFAKTLSMPFLDPAKPDFWPLAEAFTRDLRGVLREKSHLKEKLFVADLFSAEEILGMLFPNDLRTFMKMSNSGFVSNVGSFDFNKGQDSCTYRVHECLFTSIAPGFPDTFAHFNATVNGRMSWVIGYDASKIKPAQAEYFATLCFGHFDEIILQG